MKRYGYLLLTIVIFMFLSRPVFSRGQNQFRNALGSIIPGINSSIPSLISPGNGAQGLPIVVPLSWSAADSAASYALEISFDSLFTRVAYTQDQIKSTSVNVAGLSWGTKYFWHVAANINGSRGSWSESRSFAIVVRTPLLLLPVNYAINQPTTVWLNWEVIHNADYYVVEVSTTPGFSSFILNGNVKDTSMWLKGLAHNTTFYWRLRAKNSNGYSEYTQISNFTTEKTLPSALSLLSPSNGSTYQPVNITLIWNRVPDALTYRVRVSSDSTFTSTFYDDSTLKTTSVQIYGLDYGRKYFWKGNVKNSAGAGPFSKTYNFTTQLPAPENLSAISPGHNAVSLLWFDKTQNELGFVVERKSSADFNYTVLDTLPPNTTRYLDQGLTTNAVFKYRVKSFNKDAVSIYSNEAQVTALTSVEEKSALPESYELFQNYPNPFNPSTLIRYALPFESRVEIRVFNILGIAVAELKQAVEPAGYYEINLNASSLTSGIYIYSIKANSADGTKQFSAVKKMTLIK